VEKRIAKHSTGKGAKYTRSRLPVKLVWKSSGTDKSTAHKAEYYIKQKTKSDKELLVSGDASVLKALNNNFGITDWR
jgi:putative endonuclease